MDYLTVVGFVYIGRPVISLKGRINGSGKLPACFFQYNLCGGGGAEDFMPQSSYTTWKILKILEFDN